MCTVTLLPRRSGFLLAMNRDESLARVAGLPPEERLVDGLRVLHPSEPGGGTWTSVNESGTAFALVNWYAIEAPANPTAVTRGTVVLALRAESTSQGASTRLETLPLDRIRPFRVVGVFAGETRIREWRWDGRTLLAMDHPWSPGQWSSSGHDEPGAQRERGRVFQEALARRPRPDAAWLDRLHASHEPAPGPWSICMHRSDAATVSGTGISVDRSRVKLWHREGAPCCNLPGRTLELPRRAGPLAS
jgi:hypothetical protein